MGHYAVVVEGWLVVWLLLDLLPPCCTVYVSMYISMLQIDWKFLLLDPEGSEGGKVVEAKEFSPWLARKCEVKG